MLHLSLIALAAATLSSTATAAVLPSLSCFPQKVVVEDKHFREGVDLQCRLTVKPNATVDVKFKPSAYVLTSKCNLIFTAANFDKPQLVKLFPGTSVQTQTNRTNFQDTLKYSMVSNHSLYGNKTFGFPVERRFNPLMECISVGDPHIFPFSGKRFSIHTPGWQTYVDNERTTIQLLHQDCAQGKALCNGGIAIQHGGKYARIILPKVIGERPEIKLSDPNSQLITVELVENSFKSMNVRLMDGTVVLVNIAKTARSQAMNVYMRMPGKYQGQTTGICANFASKCKAGDKNCPGFTCKENCCNAFDCKKKPYPDVFRCEKTVPPPPVVISSQTPKTTSTQIPSKTESPVKTSTNVSPTNSATKSESKSESKTKTSTQISSKTETPSKTSTNALPTTVFTKTESKTESETSSSQVLPTILPPPVVPPVDDPTDDQCSKHCTKVFAGVKCGNLDASFFIESCSLDAVGNDAETVVEIAKNAFEMFMQQCAAQTKALAQSPFEDDQKVGEETAASYGIDYTTYGSDEVVTPAITCENGGTRKNGGGCACLPGFTGPTCAVKNTAQTVTSIEDRPSSATHLSSGVAGLVALVAALAM